MGQGDYAAKSQRPVGRVGDAPPQWPAKSAQEGESPGIDRVRLASSTRAQPSPLSWCWAWPCHPVRRAAVTPACGFSGYARSILPHPPRRGISCPSHMTRLPLPRCAPACRSRRPCQTISMPELRSSCRIAVTGSLMFIGSTATVLAGIAWQSCMPRIPASRSRSVPSPRRAKWRRCPRGSLPGRRPSTNSAGDRAPFKAKGARSAWPIEIARRAASKPGRPTWLLRAMMASRPGR